MSLLAYPYRLPETVISETSMERFHQKLDKTTQQLGNSMVVNSEGPLKWKQREETAQTMAYTNELSKKYTSMLTNRDIAEMLSFQYTDKTNLQTASSADNHKRTLFTDNEFSTLINPYILFDWNNDGFENIENVEKKVKEKIEAGTLFEKNFSWSKHKYFTMDEMNLMKGYLKKYELHKEQFIDKPVESDNNSENFEKKEKYVGIMRKLMRELWSLHIKQVSHENHVYCLKPSLNSPPIQKNEIKNLETSFNQIVQSEKNLKIDTSEIASRKKYEEMKWLLRASLIFSITQPVGHYRYTSYELKLLRNLYEASCTDGEKCIKNLKEIVPEIVDKFQSSHKYPRELHLKKLNMERLITAPIAWLHDFLLPFIAELNSRKLFPKDFNHFTRHFYALFSWESSDVKTFLQKRQSIKQLKSLNKKLEEISTVYPKLDSLIDRECDIINYLCGNEQKNIQRYKTVLEGLQVDSGVDENVVGEDGGDKDHEDVSDDDTETNKKDDGNLEIFEINEENKAKKSKNYTSNKDDDGGDNNFEMIHPDYHTNDDLDGDDDGLRRSRKVSKLKKRNVDLSKSSIFVNDNDGNDTRNNDNKLPNNFIKREMVRSSLEGKKISAKKLFDKTKRNFKKLVLLLQKEKKLLGFFHFKKINRFFGRFDMAAKKMI